MTAVLFGLLGALANAGQAVLSKELTQRAPARQLIGVLYAGNALVLLPFAPFVTWRWSAEIIGLQVLSVGLMVVTAVCVWDLFDHGAASATTTATAMSPIPAALAAAIVLPATIEPVQIVAAVVVVAGVCLALAGEFAGLGRFGQAWRVVGAATGTGLLTVASRLLGDAGVGIVETYVVRTALAAVICVVLFRPRDVLAADIPRLLVRSIVVTAYFVFVIAGAQAGSPVVVQTLVATTPLFVLAAESVRQRSKPPGRAVVAATIVVAGVAIIVLS